MTNDIEFHVVLRKMLNEFVRTTCEHKGKPTAVALSKREKWSRYRYYILQRDSLPERRNQFIITFVLSLFATKRAAVHKIAIVQHTPVHNENIAR